MAKKSTEQKESTTVKEKTVKTEESKMKKSSTIKKAPKPASSIDKEDLATLAMFMDIAEKEESLAPARIFFEFNENESRDSQINTFVTSHKETSENEEWILVVNALNKTYFDDSLVLGDTKVTFDRENRCVVASIYAVEDNHLNTIALTNGIAYAVKSLKGYTFIDEAIILTKNLSNVKNQNDVKSIYLYVENAVLLAGVFVSTIVQEVYKSKLDLMINDIVDRTKEKDTKKKTKETKKKDKKKKNKKKGKK